MATEGAQDALLDDRLHVGDAIGCRVTGLVKHEVAVVGLAEHAVEDDQVGMRVDVEGGAEAMKEADSSMARIQHPWPNDRFDARTRGGSPVR